MTALSSIIRAIYYLIISKLQFPSTYTNKIVRTDDGKEFKIFRHMHLKSSNRSENGSIFIVRFKFKKFSHNSNIRLSRIPILLIAGFPGFRDKFWMIDWKTNYWQGIYQWENLETIDNYKKSFVLGVMNKRAIEHSISYVIIKNRNIDDYIQSRILQ
ncbi:MAG: YdhR family protein [Ignavibacteriaceae bacterium]|nr:YdhR family protein [Ignavibacteriaceae bacterium]MCW9098352.1 YdhR family protein [Ignavibacteriaceae bacterium]